MPTHDVALQAVCLSQLKHFSDLLVQTKKVPSVADLIDSLQETFEEVALCEDEEEAEEKRK